jgi:hypothetical protein
MWWQWAVVVLDTHTGPMHVVPAADWVGKIISELYQGKDTQCKWAKVV